MSVLATRLRPVRAKVAESMRIIGNDAGERLSIQSAVISRLNRNAPDYNGYCGFNANYIRAAAGATGEALEVRS